MSENDRDDEKRRQQQASAVEMGAAGRGALSQEELDELVSSSDTGARTPPGIVGKLILTVALCWSLFQLWIASPLPFMLNFGIISATDARSVHLAFALFLAFMAYPAERSPIQLGLGLLVPVVLSGLFIYGAPATFPIWWIVLVGVGLIVAILLGSPKSWVPPWEWALALIGAGAALYVFVYSNELGRRVGAPIQTDLIAAVIGIMLLLEAARRSLGPALMIVATVFLLYTFLGPYMPQIISHRGNSLAEVANHQWVTTEGVFGIALGVSTSFVFLFVLFGALLGQGRAPATTSSRSPSRCSGHLRGGPAKAAVVAAA